MTRKPVEIERQMVAARVTAKDIAEAQRGLDDAARRRFPQYRYSSESTYTINNKLLTIRRSYEYSRWNAFKYWVRCLFTSNQNETDQAY